MATIGQDMTTSLRHFSALVSGTPPALASDAAYTPLDEPLYGTIAGKPEAFTSHGVSVDDLGAFPGGARASQIDADLANVNAARFAGSNAEGYGFRGPGTPEQAIGLPQQGAILTRLDRFGVVHLGVGPAVPIVLLAAIGGYWLFLHSSAHNRRPA